MPIQGRKGAIAACRVLRRMGVSNGAIREYAIAPLPRAVEWLPSMAWISASMPI